MNIILDHPIISICVVLGIWIIVHAFRNAPNIDEDEILERNRRVNFIYVEDVGDPSVGMFPAYWTIEAPFRVADTDETEREEFRQSVIDLYKAYCDGRCKVEYDFEMRLRDTDGE